MALFVAVPIKKTSEVDLVKPLKNVIASYYSSGEDAAAFDEAIESLNRLRKECTNKSLEFKHESSIVSLEKYYDQLCNLECKCPPSEISIPFKWRDAMMTSSFLGSNALTLNSLGYEKMCILFNVGAGQSQTAAAAVNESLTNDLALKMSTKFFCSASGIFQALKHLVPGAVGSQDLTIDLNPDVLQVMHLLMLAQAQESFFYKAVNDNMKLPIIAKIAAQCEDYYNDTLKHMQIKYSWPDKEWLPLISMKQLAFKGITEYYQGVVCGQNQSFGEQLCRLTKALEFLKQSEQKGGQTLYPSIFREYNRKTTTAYNEAKKDNEFIYHARIPDYSTLSSVGRANLAKATTLPERFRPEQPDLFEKLLPIYVQQSVAKLDARKQEIVNGEIAALRDLNNVLNASLTSMNLPAAIEDVAGVSVPPSLVQKSDAVRAKGGLNAIEQQLSELPDLLQRNKEILDETERMMTQEAESDQSLREQFKERWTRVPSDKLTGAWKDNITKYRNIIQTAIEADNKVRAKFNDQREKIRILTEGAESLQRSLPAGNTGSHSNSSVVNRLRVLMNQVEALKNEREVIESELKNYSFTEMKNRFLKALIADNAMNEAALSVESLGEAYGPLQKQVRESRERQEALLKDIETANNEFVRSKGSLSGQDATRESYLAELAAAHDSYFEISSNLAEGTKFYNDLTQLLVNLQNKVSDFCFARKAEREEMCKDLQHKIVNASNPAPPAAPSYHTPSTAPPVIPQPTPQMNLPYSAPNPYQQYYYPPPPLPVGYNPYAQPPAPPAPCEYSSW